MKTTASGALLIGAGGDGGVRPTGPCASERSVGTRIPRRLSLCSNGRIRGGAATGDVVGGALTSLVADDELERSGSAGVGESPGWPSAATAPRMEGFQISTTAVLAEVFALKRVRWPWVSTAAGGISWPAGREALGRRNRGLFWRHCSASALLRLANRERRRGEEMSS